MAYGDHPRVCGEHNTGVYALSDCTGSSPRMRGTRTQNALSCDVWGIIPAYAGNTEDASLTLSIAEDHPRVCGEHRGDGAGRSGYEGSSPRMRGTLGRRLFRFRSVGIIPAYAGNTAVFRKTPTRHRDHPRVCGEHQRVNVLEHSQTGSSPRMRGTLTAPARKYPILRIIPAYAGNTNRRAIRMADNGDHPRVCGEHLKLVV